MSRDECGRRRDPRPWDRGNETSSGGATGGNGATAGTGGAGTGGDGSGGGPLDGCNTSAPSENCRCIEGSWSCSICTDNLACAPGEYCKSPQAEGGCDVFASPGSCQPKPEICNEGTSGLGLPVIVCGCDQNTYASECEAAKAGINVKNEGACSTQKPL